MNLEKIRGNIIDSIGSIKEPDHPSYTLEQLEIVKEEDIFLIDKGKYLEIVVYWAPACHSCSFVNNIGLCMHYKLIQDFPEQKFKVRFFMKEGSHVSKDEIDKQVNDKERVLAALENPAVIDMVQEAIGD